MAKGSMAVHTAEVSNRALHVLCRLDADVGANRLPPSADLARQLAASSRTRRKAPAEPAGAFQMADDFVGGAAKLAYGRLVFRAVSLLMAGEDSKMKSSVAFGP